jgi:hypothetical protein
MRSNVRDGGLLTRAAICCTMSLFWALVLRAGEMPDALTKVSLDGAKQHEVLERSEATL